MKIILFSFLISHFVIKQKVFGGICNKNNIKDPECIKETELWQAYQEAIIHPTTAVSTNTETPPKIQSITPGIAFRFEATAPGFQFVVSQGNLVPIWKRGKKFSESAVNDIDLTLEQIYNGYIKPATWMRTKICPVCLGKGATESNLINCPNCIGTGSLHNSHDHSCFSHVSNDHTHHFHQTLDVACNLCHGKGEILKPIHGHNCSICNGTGIVEEKISKKVIVPRGAPDEHLIFFKGSGNQNLETKPADMIVRVHVLDHDVFERDGDDLIIAVNISLKEALLGFNRTIKHLNSTPINIVHKEITVPLQEFTWAGFGMPIFVESCKDDENENDCGNEAKVKEEVVDVDVETKTEKEKVVEFGNLVMRVHVVLPETLKKHQSAAFRSALRDGDED